MSTWNYRLFIFENPDDSIWFQICECYYDADGTPNGYIENHACAGGETVEEVKNSLEMMKGALDKPVIYAGDKFPQEYKLNNY